MFSIPPKFALCVVSGLLGLLSCATQWTYVPQTGHVQDPIRVCLAVPAHEQEFAQAVTSWDKATHQWRPMVVSQLGCDVTVLEAEKNPCQTPDALACVNDLGGDTVYMVKGRYEDDPTGVLLHELGHILGAQHLDGTLMQAEYSRHYDCPDLWTVLQVAAYHHAPLTEFSWCYR